MKATTDSIVEMLGSIDRADVVPVAIIFSRAGDLITEYQIYADVAPVFAASA